MKKAAQDFWSFSPLSRRSRGSVCEISSRHQQIEAPRFIGIFHTMSCSFKGAVQFSTWRTTWLSFQRNKLYLYLAWKWDDVYNRGKIDYIYSLPPHLHPFHFQSLTDHMPRIHFIANKAAQRQQGRAEEWQQWKENEKEYNFLFDLLRLFYDCFFFFVWRHV